MKIGQKIAKYEITSGCHAGLGAETFFASDPSSGQSVLLLLLEPVVVDDKDEENRRFRAFHLELEKARKLVHPNIARVLDSGVNDRGDPFLVVECRDGMLLDRLLQNTGGISSTQALHYIAQIAAALDFAHKGGLCHGSLSKTNVFIDKQGSVLLYDLGVCRLFEICGLPVGGVLGEPDCLSAEHVKGEQRTISGDFYAFALLAYELITGRCPFDVDDLGAQLQMTLSGRIPNPRQADPSLPQGVEVLFGRVSSPHSENVQAPFMEFASELGACFGVEVSHRGAGHIKSEIKAGSPVGKLPNIQVDKPVNKTVKGTQKPSTSLSSVVRPPGTYAPVASARSKRGSSGLRNLIYAVLSSAVLLVVLMAVRTEEISRLLDEVSLWVDGVNETQTQGEILEKVEDAPPVSVPPNALPTVPAAPTPDMHKDESPNVVEKAVENIAADPAIAPVLRFPGLDSSSTEQLAFIADAVKAGTDGYIEDLLKLLDSHEPIVKVHVMRELSRARLQSRPEVLSKIVVLLSDADSLVRGFAVRSLGPLDTDESQRALKQRVGIEDDVEVNRLLGDSIRPRAEKGR